MEPVLLAVGRLHLPGRHAHHQKEEEQGEARAERAQPPLHVLVRLLQRVRTRPCQSALGAPVGAGAGAGAGAGDGRTRSPGSAVGVRQIRGGAHQIWGQDLDRLGSGRSSLVLRGGLRDPRRDDQIRGWVSRGRVRIDRVRSGDDQIRLGPTSFEVGGPPHPGGYQV